MSLQRYVVGSFVVLGALAGWAVQAAAVSGFAQFAIPDTSIGGLLSTSSLLGLVVGVVTFVAFIRNVEAVKFWGETVAELSKVTWPTKDETVRASTTVVLTTLFVAGLVGAYDFLWKNVADIFLFTEI